MRQDDPEGTLQGRIIKVDMARLIKMIGSYPDHPVFLLEELAYLRGEVQLGSWWTPQPWPDSQRVQTAALCGVAKDFNLESAKDTRLTQT